MSDPSRFCALQHSLATYGLILSDKYYSRMVGRTTEMFLGEMFPDPRDGESLGQALVQYGNDYRDHVEDCVEMITPTVSFLRSYQGPLPIAIASMSPRRSIDRILNRFDISSRFTAVLSRDDVDKNKPDPEIYIKVASRLGVEPDKCCVFEDSPPGVEAALGAGMRCFVLLNGVNSREDFAVVKPAGFVTTEGEMRTALSTG